MFIKCFQCCLFWAQGRAVLSCPLLLGWDHVTYSGQWEVNRNAVSFLGQSIEWLAQDPPESSYPPLWCPDTFQAVAASSPGSWSEGTWERIPSGSVMDTSWEWEINFVFFRHPGSVQFSSVAQSCLTLCNTIDCTMPGLPVHHQLPELAETHVYWVNDAIQPSHPLLPLLLLPSIFPSIRVFSSESVLHIRWPKYWSFSFSTSPSSAYSGLISFRNDWFELLAVQGTLKSLQHHSSLEKP